MTNGNILTEDDRDRIAAAIRHAERNTSGEIYCVLARTSDSYFYPAALFMTLTTIVASLLVALMLHQWWIAITPVHLVFAQLAALAAALGVMAAFPRLRIHFVPRRLRYRRAHENALRQFLAHNIHVTQERTGALIFVSLAEHYAEIVADSGINERVPQERWNETVAALTRRASQGALADGYVEAVQMVGADLARNFPPGQADADELDNHVAEI